jgi:membrane protein DedA with SNARE-associated domain
MPTPRMIVAVAVVVFVVGSLLGAIWDKNDTIGAIATGMWALSIVLIILAIAVFVMRRRNPSVTRE